MFKKGFGRDLTTTRVDAAVISTAGNLEQVKMPHGCAFEHSSREKVTAGLDDTVKKGQVAILVGTLRRKPFEQF